MTTPPDLVVKTQWFTAQADERAGGLSVSMSGNADMDIHERLKVFLHDLHVRALTIKATEIVFQFQELYFMNSSCMSLMLRFINDIISSRPSEQYKVRLLYNPEQRWQKKSFDAMCAYAPDLVSVA